MERLINVEIRDYSVDPNQKIVHVIFQGAENLTSGFTRRGIEMAMWRGYHAIFTCGAEHVARASMEARMKLMDKLGNESMGIVYGTKLTDDVAGKINWANRDSIDPTVVWKVYRLNRSFRK